MILWVIFPEQAAKTATSENFDWPLAYGYLRYSHLQYISEQTGIKIPYHLNWSKFGNVGWSCFLDGNFQGEQNCLNIFLGIIPTPDCFGVFGWDSLKSTTILRWPRRFGCYNLRRKIPPFVGLGNRPPHLTLTPAPPAADIRFRPNWSKRRKAFFAFQGKKCAIIKMWDGMRWDGIGWELYRVSDFSLTILSSPAQDLELFVA